jgi:transposase
VQRRSGGAVAAIAEAGGESQETPTDPDGLLLESKMTQAEIAKTARVSLSTVKRARTAYNLGGCAALDPKARGGRIRENMTLAKEKALLERLSGQ